MRLEEKKLEISEAVDIEWVCLIFICVGIKLCDTKLNFFSNENIYLNKFSAV